MTTPSNGGGPAFPVLETAEFRASHEGMTLRQYYAGKALAGLLANSARYTHIIITQASSVEWLAETSSRLAVKSADLLIAELGKTP
jgi:hypothetical protein